MMHKAWSGIEEVPYCFSRSSIKFQGHTALKIVKFDPNWAFPDCNSSFNTNGNEMMHKAWSRIEEVPYCFSRSYIKLQGHTALKIVEFDPNWAFPDCNVCLEWPMAMKCCTKLEVAWKWCPIVFSRSHVKLQGNTAKKIFNFDPNLAFPDCKSSLNSLMATKWCIELEVA